MSTRRATAEHPGARRFENMPARLRVLWGTALISSPFLLLLAYALVRPWLSGARVLDGLPPLRDAYVLWTAGRLTLQHLFATLYAPDALNETMSRWLHAPVQHDIFAYPPSALPFLAAWAKLPYVWAAGFWLTLSLVAYLSAVATRHARPASLILALLAPSLILDLNFGQTGLLCAALAIGGLRLSHRRPVIAGVLIGLLSFKPTMGILIPVLLGARGQWRTMAVAFGTAAALALLPICIWGWSVWALYLESGLGGVHELLAGTSSAGSAGLISILKSAELEGFSAVAAYRIQTVWTIAVLLLFLLYLRRTSHRALITAIDLPVVTAATLLMTPYVHGYDFVLLEGSLIVFAAAPTTVSDQPSVALSLALIGMWSIGLTSTFLNLFSVPIGPLILLACLITLMRDSAVDSPPLARDVATHPD